MQFKDISNDISTTFVLLKKPEILVITAVLFFPIIIKTYVLWKIFICVVFIKAIILRVFGTSKPLSYDTESLTSLLCVLLNAFSRLFAKTKFHVPSKKEFISLIIRYLVILFLGLNIRFLLLWLNWINEYMNSLKTLKRKSIKLILVKIFPYIKKSLILAIKETFKDVITKGTFFFL